MSPSKRPSPRAKEKRKLTCSYYIDLQLPTGKRETELKEKTFIDVKDVLINSSIYVYF